MLSDGSSVTTDIRREVIATVVCDVPSGQLVTYRPYSELLQLNNEMPASLRFYLTDGYERRLPPRVPRQHPFMQMSISAYDCIEER